MTEVAVDNHIRITDGAQQAFVEAQQKLIEARQWVENGEWFVEDEITISTGDEIQQRAQEYHDQLREMEYSLYSNLCHLFFARQDHDGLLEFWRDMEGSFFWKHTKSGYHGGLIAHPVYHNGERTPIYTWSIHT